MQDIKVLSPSEVLTLKTEIKDKIPYVSDEGRKQELLSYIGLLDDVNNVKVVCLWHDGFGIQYQGVTEKPIWNQVKKGFATKSNVKIVHQVAYILCNDFVTLPRDNEGNDIYTNMITKESFLVERTRGDGNPGTMIVKPPVI